MLALPGMSTVLQALKCTGYLSTLAQTTLLRSCRSCKAFGHLVRDADDVRLLQSHVSATQHKLTEQGKPLASHIESQSPRGRQDVLPCNPQQQLAPTRQQQLRSTCSDAQQAPNRNASSQVQHDSPKQHKAQHCKVQVDYAPNMVASSPQDMLTKVSEQTVPSSGELQMLQWPVTKPKHITSQLVILRRLALANMLDGPSALKAISEYNAEVNILLDKHQALCNFIAASAALLSLAHLTQRAETFGITLNPSVVQIAHKLLHLTVAQQHTAERQSIANVFWALARLRIPPASVAPEYEASLAQTYLAVQHSSILDVSNVLWALSNLNINPLKGKLLGQLIQRTEKCIADPALVSSQYTQVTHFVQQTWPLGPSPAELQSRLGSQVYHTLLQMGFQAAEHHDAGDGLHDIDVALPQKGVPVKVAVEADGPDHYLFEDFRLQASLQPATRPNGPTLFRNAVLRKQGWIVLSISYFEWDLLTHASRPKYLAEKLHQLMRGQT